MARNVQVPDTFAGVFSSGSWSHDTRMAYDKIVAMLNKLPAAGGRLRNADDEKVNAESVKAVKAFLEDLPDFKHHHGIASWHEGSKHVLKKLDNIGGTFATELLRRRSVMAGQRSFRVTLEPSTAQQKLQPNATLPNIIWHVVVDDNCGMQELRQAIATEGNYCASADIAAVKILVGTGNFNIGQYVSKEGKKGKMSKPQLAYADTINELVCNDGYYDVYVVRKSPRKNRSRGPKKPPNKEDSVTVKGTQGSQDGNGTNGADNKSSSSVKPNTCVSGKKRPLEPNTDRSQRHAKRAEAQLQRLPPPFVPSQSAGQSPAFPGASHPPLQQTLSNTSVMSELDTSNDKDILKTLLLRMGHTHVVTLGNGYCGYFCLSEMSRVLSPFQIIQHWRAVFVSRVASNAATDAKKAEVLSVKSNAAKDEDALANEVGAEKAAALAKEAMQASAHIMSNLDFDYKCPWSQPPDSTTTVSMEESASASTAIVSIYKPDADTIAHSRPNPKERLQVMFDYLDEEIDKDNRNSDSSIYRRLKHVIGLLEAGYAYKGNGCAMDPKDQFYVGEKGWVHDSLVDLQAIVDGVDYLIIDGRVLTLRKADGKQLLLGRPWDFKQKGGNKNATPALQRSTVLGNVWSRRSVGVAVGGRISSKGKLACVFPDGWTAHPKKYGLFARPGPWHKTRTTVLHDIWARVIEYLPYFKVLIHLDKNHWEWAYPDTTFGVKERLGRFTAQQMSKTFPRKVSGLSRSKIDWWVPLQERIRECVAQEGLRTPVRTGWAFRHYMTQQMDWGFHGVAPSEQHAYPRLHHECGVKSLLVAVRAGLRREERPASTACVADLLLEHLEVKQWLYVSLMGPMHMPLKWAREVLRGSATQNRASRDFEDPLAVPMGIAVILVAVAHVFKVDLHLSFHHGRCLTKLGEDDCVPVRMKETHYHSCNSTRRVLHPDQKGIVRGTLQLAWLHMEDHWTITGPASHRTVRGPRNIPVFFLLEGGPDRNRFFEVVHSSDEVVHDYDVTGPPTTTPLTIYGGPDGLMLLSSGDAPRSQMYDVRPSGVVPDDTVFLRWRETAALPPLATSKGIPTRRGKKGRHWSAVIEVRVGCSVHDLKCQDDTLDPVASLPPSVTKNAACYILDHTGNGDGLKYLAKIQAAAGYEALRAHAKLQATRSDLSAEIRSAMVDDEDETRIVNPPWSACSDFIWESSKKLDNCGKVLYSTTELLGGTVSHAQVPGPILEGSFPQDLWLPRPKRHLPSAGMHVRTYDAAGTAHGHYVVRYSYEEDKVWLQREFVLTPREVKLVKAEHNGKIPDAQAVFTVMFPQFMYLINMPLHAWVSLNDPTHPRHMRTDQVTTEGEEKYGFTPRCVEGITQLRINRSNLLCPLLYKATNIVGKSWRSLDYGWMLQNWDSEHFRLPEGYPLTMKEWLQYGEDGDVMWQKNGCSGVTDGGILPLVNPFVRLATLSTAIKHVDQRENCVGRSILLLGFVEDAEVPSVANWAPRVSLRPFDGREGTLHHALNDFNSKGAKYYIRPHQVFKLAHDSAYDAKVKEIQKDGMNGIAEVAVKDLECESGVRTNHVMAVVNGCLVDPSDGSSHAWPDRRSTARQSSWLRNVTLFIPLTKMLRAPPKKRLASNLRNYNKRAIKETANTLNEGVSKKASHLTVDH